MGRTACTEPQCLYRGALYLYVFNIIIIIIIITIIIILDLFSLVSY